MSDAAVEAARKIHLGSTFDDKVRFISEAIAAHTADLTARLASAEGERDHWKQEYADQMIRPCHVAHHEDQEIEVDRLKAAVEQALIHLQGHATHGGCSGCRDLLTSAAGGRRE